MKTETEQFVEDAIKGGWRAHWYPREEYCSEEQIIELLSEYKDEWYTNYYGMVVDTNHPFLDPLAWQAVGKTRGWEKLYNHEDTQSEAAEIRATDFMGYLFDGKTIEEALLAIK